MTSFIRNDNVKFEYSGRETIRIILARHQKICSVGSFFCVKCPNFSTRSQTDLNFHTANCIADLSQKTFTSVNFVMNFFAGFYSL